MSLPFGCQHPTKYLQVLTMHANGRIASVDAIYLRQISEDPYEAHKLKRTEKDDPSTFKGICLNDP